jgi:hypothetical protein
VLNFPLLSSPATYNTAKQTPEASATNRRYHKYENDKSIKFNLLFETNKMTSEPRHEEQTTYRFYLIHIY